jgi:hypothetical protein
MDEVDDFLITINGSYRAASFAHKAASTLIRDNLISKKLLTIK